MRTLETGVLEPMGLLPPKEPPPPEDVGRSVYLPIDLWDQLTAIADDSRAEDPLGKGYSRNEVIKHALRRFVDEYAREKKERKKR